MSKYKLNCDLPDYKKIGTDKKCKTKTREKN